MSKIFKQFKEIGSYFNFKVNIEFKIKQPDNQTAYEVLFIEKENKVIVSGIISALEEDVAEICGLIKLGEIHPLLCTFFFQKDIDDNSKIARYCSMFYELCQPLQDAWTWKMMQTYLPENIFDKEMDKLLNFYKNIKSSLFKLDEYGRRRIQIGLYTVLYGLGYNVKMELQGEGEYLEEWKKYLKALEKFSVQNPNPNLFTKLPVITNAPYRVFIQDKPYLHYEILTIQ